MEQSVEAPRMSKGALWAGRILSGLAAAFLAVDAVVKLLQLEPAIKGTAELGYPVGVVFPLGIVLAICVGLYIVPRTRVLGAILLTGYLGGAVATHVRVSGPLASHVLSPVYFGVVLWLGLWLRDSKLRALVPLVR